MDVLTLFGVFSVTAMLVFYALDERSPWFVLAFAAACGLASLYGFLQGTWPFGVIEAIWAGVAAVAKADAYRESRLVFGGSRADVRFGS